MFSVLMIVLVILVGYYHYTQGMFSAILSLVFAAVASLVAIGYHEYLAAMLGAGRFLDSSSGMIIAILFCVVYVVLRTLFDSLVPGNVALPVWVDRIGGGFCGLLVGVLGVGTFAVAAQTLPFGPSVLFYDRYELTTLDAVVAGRRSARDAQIHDALAVSKMNNETESGMLLPVDNLVLDFVKGQSNGGAMAGAMQFSEIHPDFLSELFGWRLGIEQAARKTAANFGETKMVTANEVFALKGPIRQVFHESSVARPGDATKPTIGPGETLIVVRMVVNETARDIADNQFRFSPSSVRLKLKDENYRPIGTMFTPLMMIANKLYDYLYVPFASGDSRANLPIDLVFSVPTRVLPGGTALPEGAFLEVKRYARVDLSGVAILPDYTPPPPGPNGTGDVILRKTDLTQRMSSATATPPPGTLPPGAD